MKITSLEKARTLKALKVIYPEIADLLLTKEGEMLKLVDENIALKVQVAEQENLLCEAWAVIANVAGWDDPERAEWREAAEGWRDRWFETLTSTPDGPGPRPPRSAEVQG